MVSLCSYSWRPVVVEIVVRDTDFPEDKDNISVVSDGGQNGGVAVDQVPDRFYGQSDRK